MLNEMLKDSAFKGSREMFEIFSNICGYTSEPSIESYLKYKDCIIANKKGVSFGHLSNDLEHHFCKGNKIDRVDFYCIINDYYDRAKERYISMIIKNLQNEFQLNLDGCLRIPFTELFETDLFVEDYTYSKFKYLITLLSAKDKIKPIDFHNLVKYLNNQHDSNISFDFGYITLNNNVLKLNGKRMSKDKFIDFLSCINV